MMLDFSLYVAVDTSGLKFPKLFPVGGGAVFMCLPFTVMIGVIKLITVIANDG